MVLNLSAFQLASAAGIAVLFPLFNLMLITLKEDITTVDSPENEYDYIVVGGGTSGALIASKLASQSDNKVLLVEAGGKVPWFSRIPAAFQPLNQQIKSIDWLSWTEPQTESLFGYIGQKTLWHRGKVLGGSSGINGMVYYWPAPEDMDSWADRFNDPKWKFENMQKHFRNIEDTEFVDKPSRGRGRSGGIRVQSSPACQEPGLCQSFLEAAQYKGHPVRDINSAQNYGFMPGQGEQVRSDGRPASISSSLTCWSIDPNCSNFVARSPGDQDDRNHERLLIMYTKNSTAFIGTFAASRLLVGRILAINFENCIHTDSERIISLTYLKDNIQTLS